MVSNNQNKIETVSFLLPALGKNVAGGYKIAFTYANLLADHGYLVNIILPYYIKIKKIRWKRLLASIKNFLINKVYGTETIDWFKFHKNVNLCFVKSLKEKNVPNSHCYIATGVATAYYLSEYKHLNILKLYLIQDFEDWEAGENYVLESYKLGLKNLVISNWLLQKVESAGASATVIPNAFDFDRFFMKTPIEKKNPLRISMLYHSDERKGCKYGIEALSIVKQKFPTLQVSLFGVPPRPDELPKWMDYFQKPGVDILNDIYDQSAIYLAPSLQEGWGLTVGEAAICGSAIVCTDTLGFQEMVENGESAIICPIRDSQSLANSIIYLIENPQLRIKLAYNSHESVKRFSWNNSFKILQDQLINYK